MSVALGLVGGVAVDRALGDPERGHPVAAFGASAGALEARLYAPRIEAGALVAALSIAGAALPVLVADRRLAGASIARAATGAAVVWSCLGGRSLWAIGDQLAGHLERGDLEAARRLLPSLAGRDPSQLDASGIARAATESIAENTADAILGTLVWGAALGPAGAVVHRAANTLDAMHGHRSPRYARFGTPAARLDDALGFLPARLGAWLAVLLAPVVDASTNSASPGDLTTFVGTPSTTNTVRTQTGGRRAGAGGSRWAAARVLWRDGRNHPSPNAGPMEAAFAGALGVRLGGPLMYGDRPEVRGTLNADGRDPDAQGLRDAVRLSRAVSYATLGVVIAARLGWFSWVTRVGSSPRVAGGRSLGWFGRVTRVGSRPRVAGGRGGGLR
ncbi:MAG: cobalamin biosynthesis protein [Solirubrobacteraceae bacterium]|nr:cobalamin biosynthesis protein [Solirubrobacteraceae bacterium]